MLFALLKLFNYAQDLLVLTLTLALFTRIFGEELLVVDKFVYVLVL